jgi:high-affinity Fe2+/Pb2+ permease
MKDYLAAVEELGITLPSTAYIVGVVTFGIAGYVVYRYGKKMSLQATSG